LHVATQSAVQYQRISQEDLYLNDYQYERFDPVRAREMQEARDDIAFVRYHQDADFVALTQLASADADSYHQTK